MKLPSPIRQRLQGNAERYVGNAGSLWVASLPVLLDRAVERWSLALDAPFPDTTVSYVAPATRADGTRCVLKVAFPESELLSGIEALRAWNGNGAAALLDAHPADGALLVEYVYPGTLLEELADVDDDSATRAIASVVQAVWIEPPPARPLIDLRRWFDCLLNPCPRSGGGSTS